MPQLKISYTPWRVKITNEIIFRPSLVIELQTPLRQVRLLSVVDSGADYCLFPGSIGELLGLAVSKGRLRRVTGIGGIEQSAYFHQVKLSIPEGPNYIGLLGFSIVLDYLKCGVLGHVGFFDRFEVCFNTQRRFFSLHWEE